MIKFANYGQDREIHANDDELLIIAQLLEINNELKICRKSDNYITAVFSLTDVARFKYTPRAKWINFPYTKGKVELHSTSDITKLADDVREAIEVAARTQ